MLEKLLTMGCFGGSINHLLHCQATFLPLGGLNFPFVVWTTTPTFLKCWALIDLALITHFQHDDCPILLDVVAHVGICPSMFQMAL
jgi:hypothetical protein